MESPNCNEKQSFERNDLAKLLKSEIKSKQLYREKGMPADFAFTIHDNDDPSDERESNFSRLFDHVFSQTDDIYLTREFDGDWICVMVKQPYPMPKYDDINDYDSTNNGGSRRRLRGDDRKWSFGLVVKIIKENGTKLIFNASASAYEIAIDSISVELPTDERRLTPAEYTVDKDCSLQCALREYLKTRGIHKSMTDFLCKYMVRKSKKQPVIVLKNFLKFIK